MKQSDKKQALQAAFDSMQTRLPSFVSYSLFKRLTKEWEVYPVKVNKIIIGALLIDGAEIHACIKPEGFNYWFNKAMLTILNNIIKEYGFALTRVAEGNEVGIAFVERLGFHKNTVWNNTIIYIKD